MIKSKRIAGAIAGIVLGASSVFASGSVESVPQDVSKSYSVSAEELNRTRPERGNQVGNLLGDNFVDSTKSSDNNDLAQVRTVTDYGRNSDFEHPRVSTDLDGFTLAMEFDYVSQRPDFENGVPLTGETHTYEIWTKDNELVVKEKDKNVIVGINTYWDIDQDGLRGYVERDAEKNGYIVDFAPAFTDLLLENIVAARNRSGLEASVQAGPSIGPKREQIGRNPSSLIDDSDSVSGVEVEQIGRNPSSLIDDGKVVAEPEEIFDKPKEVTGYTSLRAGPVVGYSGERGFDFGANAGVGFYGENLGFDLFGGVRFGEDGKIIREVSEDVPATDLSVYGNVSQDSLMRYTVGGDFKLGFRGQDLSAYLNLGAGAEFAKTSDKVIEEIRRDGNTLASNTAYDNAMAISPFISGGLDLIHNKSGFGGEVGITYNPMDGNVSVNIDGIVEIPTYKEGRHSGGQD